MERGERGLISAMPSLDQGLGCSKSTSVEKNRGAEAGGSIGLTRRLTAIVRDEDLPDEARAAPGQHVILKLNLGGGHCDHEGMEQGRECQVGLDRGKSGSREQGSEVRGIGRAQGFGRSLSGDDRRSGVDDRRLRVPVLLVYWRPRSRSRCARLNDTFLTRFSSTHSPARPRSTPFRLPVTSVLSPPPLGLPLGAEMNAASG